MVAGCKLKKPFVTRKARHTGLAVTLHRTKNKARLEVLLLLAALANWLHYMLGLAAELAGKHWQFQANTVKHRRVLSFNYLGKRLCRLARVKITAEEIHAAIRQILAWAAYWDWKNVRKIRL